jgi:hypothetical protein
MFWFIAAGGLAGAFWGAVLAVALKLMRKKRGFPWWLIVSGTMAGAIFGFLKLSSYG